VIFWVVTSCGVAGYHLPQYHMTSQPRRPQAEYSPLL